jgi:hypothetical protein
MPAHTYPRRTGWTVGDYLEECVARVLAYVSVLTLFPTLDTATEPTVAAGTSTSTWAGRCSTSTVRSRPIATMSTSIYAFVSACEVVS